MVKRVKRRKRRRLKWRNIIIAIILLLVIIGGLIAGTFFISKKTSNKNTAKVKTEKKIFKKVKEKDTVTKVSVITAGDNLIHSSVYKDANSNANYKGYDFKPMYEFIKPIKSRIFCYLLNSFFVIFSFATSIFI